MNPSEYDQRSLNEALDWFIELREAHTDDPQHYRWQTWLAASPHNQQAWQRVEALRQRLSGTEGALLLSAWRSTPARTSRRAFVGKLCLLLGGAGALAYSGQRAAWPELTADYRTHTGQLRMLALNNNLKLELNTATSLDIRQDSHGTLIALMQGEIMVDSRQALPVATQVQTGQARIQAEQARFAVRVLGDEPSRISVYQGRVGVTLAGGEHSLVAGQQLSFSPAAVSRQELPLASDAWTRGLLISDGMPLADFARELNRYRRGLLHCDPRIANLRISGSFDLNNPEQVLATLSQVLPVQVQYRSRYWATLVPAA